jgi:hypothetical protein
MICPVDWVAPIGQESTCDPALVQKRGTNSIVKSEFCGYLTLTAPLHSLWVQKLQQHHVYALRVFQKTTWPLVVTNPPDAWKRLYSRPCQLVTMLLLLG